jgi:hypothetical protein
MHVRTIHIPRKKTVHTLWPLKDRWGLKIFGVYRIPCNWGRVYVGQTKRSLGMRRKEHTTHLCLEQPDQSAVAGHIMETAHYMRHTRLARTKGYWLAWQKNIEMEASKQWDRTNAYWLASTHDTGHPWANQQGKWRAELFLCPDFGDRVSVRKVGVFELPDAAVIPRKLYWISATCFDFRCLPKTNFCWSPDIFVSGHVILLWCHNNNTT